VAFGHLLHFISEVNAEKRDAYHRLHDHLYELDDFLRSKPQRYELVSAAQSFSWELKKLRLRDFPVMDWDERVQPILDEREKGNLSRQDIHLPTRLLPASARVRMTSARSD
jgi:hypothetical protein